MARLLALVPLVNSRGEVSIEEASTALGVSGLQLKKDIERLFMCGLPGGMPDDLIDVDFEALDTSGVIRVSNADYLNRPLRLTATEASALVVALRTLRAGSSAESCEVVDRTLAKLERAAAGATSLVEPGPMASHPTDPALVEIVREAIQTDRQLQIGYYVPSRDEQTLRTIDPRGLFTDHGVVYLDAWCHLAEAPRSFRVDRIRSAHMLASRTARPVEASELTSRLFARDEGLTKVTLALEEAANWAVEYYPVEEVRPQPDGGLEVDLMVADEAWFVRMMLRLTPHAKIVAPTQFSERFRDVVQATLDLYA
ncbi:YafY family protein [soil metagenome]